MDNAATTRVTEPVVEAMLPYLSGIYGNPSSIHSFAREARKGIDAARARVAAAINAEINEIYFTGSGTEADNWAIRGAAHANVEKGKHIITTQIEHHAVLHTCRRLEREGFNVTYLPVDEMGMISLESLSEAMTDKTTLVTIIAANNEIGAIQPIAEIGALVKTRGALFHTDAVQAIGAVPIDVKDMNIDMLSLSGHKFHAPKGVGALYMKRGVMIPNLIEGGAQERGKRAGTENVASIAGMGKAIEQATADIAGSSARLIELRDALITGIMDNITEVRLNGHPTRRLPGNVNISIKYIEGEALLLNLDLKGVAASSGSACTSGSLDPSHVLLAIGLPHETAQGSLRLSLGDENTMEEVRGVVAALVEITSRLRAMSPLYDN
jgi:cysteine desulfurase